MSASILYRAFGLKSAHYETTHFSGDSITIDAQMTDQHVKCPNCAWRRATFNGQKRRLLRMSPIGRKHCFVNLLLHRLKCQDCGHIYWPTLPLMARKRKRRYSTLSREALQVADRVIVDSLHCRYFSLNPPRYQYINNAPHSCLIGNYVHLLVSKIIVKVNLTHRTGS
jgi:hypothetical protein